MFVVVEKIEQKKVLVYGPFETKQDATYWADIKGQIKPDVKKGGYLLKTYSVKEVLKI